MCDTVLRLWENIIKTKLIPYCDYLFLNSIVNRNAAVFTFFPYFVFLFSRRVNSLTAGRLLRIAHRTQNFSRFLSQNILTEKVVCINCNKEVTEMIRADFSVFVFSVKSLS